MVALAVVYVLGLGVEPAYGDATSFTLSAAKGFDWATNATSHFLYGLVLRCIAILVGTSNVLWALPMFSAVCAVLTLVAVNRLLKNLGVVEGTRTLCLLLFGLSFTFWRNAETTEVYTFNTLLCAVYLYQVVSWSHSRKGQHFLLGSLVLGAAPATK